MQKLVDPSVSDEAKKRAVKQFFTYVQQEVPGMQPVLHQDLIQTLIKGKLNGDPPRNIKHHQGINIFAFLPHSNRDLQELEKAHAQYEMSKDISFNQASTLQLSLGILPKDGPGLNQVVDHAAKFMYYFLGENCPAYILLDQASKGVQTLAVRANNPALNWEQEFARPILWGQLD